MKKLTAVLNQRSKQGCSGKIQARIIIAFAILLLVVFAGLPVFAANDEPTPNMDLLNAMLDGERSWVLDTLIDNDYSTNPQARLIGINSNDSMMDYALDQYNNADQTAYGAVYKGLVDVLEKLVNADMYKQSFFDSVTELWNDVILDLFGSGDSFSQTVDDLAGSVDELQYESIIKAALTADYRSSAGLTLAASESDYANLKQLQKSLQATKALNSYLISANNYAVGSDEALSISEYTNDFVLPYSQALSGYLTSVGDYSGSQHYAQQNYADLAGYLSAIYRFEKYNGSNWIGESFGETVAEFYADAGVIDLLRGAGKTLDYSSTAIENYIYLNTIQGQKESITGPLRRMAAATSDSDLAKVTNRFADLTAVKADAQTVAYESMRDYLRSHNTTYTYASKAVKGLAGKVLDLGNISYLTGKLSEVSAVVDISTWVLEEAVGWKSTVKLTYELKYLNKIINEAKRQYNRDLATYRANPSEENAAKVLDDLMLIQKLRLRGEKIAYNMSSAQFTSTLGQMFSWADDLHLWTQQYQYRVDSLLAASVTGAANQVISVGNGASLSLFYNNYYGGWYGQMETADGRSYDIAEIIPRLYRGLELNGGTLNVYNTSGAAFSLPYIATSGAASVNVYGHDLHLYELLQNSGTLAINIADGQTLTVTQLLKTTNCVITGENPVIIANAELSGTISGATLKISGDCISNAATADAIEFCGDSAQRISGSSLQLSRLSITNTNSAGLAVDANVKVSGSVYGPTARTVNGKNILLDGGSVSGAFFNGSLSIQNVELNGTDFAGSLYDRGGSEYGGDIEISGGLLAGGVSTLEGRLTVHELAWFNCNGLNGTGQLVLYGDLAADGSANLATSVLFCGATVQQLSGTLDIGQLVINNSGAGLNVSGELKATKSLEIRAGNILAAQPISLADGAVFVGEVFHCNFSVGRLTLTAPVSIDGNLLLRDGGRLQGQELTVNGTLRNVGTGLISDCRVTASALNTQGSLSLEQGAELSIINLLSASGTLRSPGEINVGGDLVLTDLTAEAPLRSQGDVLLAGTVSLAELTLDGFLPQKITGSNFSVGDLYFRNTSISGVSLSPRITVSGQYEADCRVSGGAVVGVITADQTVVEDTHISSDLTLDGDLRLSDCSLTIDGALTLSNGKVILENASLNVGESCKISGGTVILENASLNVGGNCNLTGGAPQLDDSSSMTTGGWAVFSGGAGTIDGRLCVGGDLSLSNAALAGSGTLELKGDLAAASSLSTEVLRLNGLVRQRITGGDTHVGQLILENPSRGGILFQSQVYYSGELESGETVVNDASYLIKEEK